MKYLELITQSIIRIKESEERISKCLNELSEEQIWQKPNSQLNSVGNLVHHVCGNMTQYIYASLGQNADERNRDSEFSVSEGSKEELTELITKSCAQVYSVLKNISETELLKERSVQGFNLTGIGIVIHVTEHFSYHTGQITFWTKFLLNKDLGYYADLDLTITG